MAYMEWTNDLSVKVTSFDNQHKKLIEMINDFYASVEKGKLKEVVQKLLIEMQKYTKTHFYSEENYMVKYNYPDYAEHKKEHEVFIKKVEELMTKYSEGKMILSFDITKFLKDWLVNHIQGTDKKYSEFMNKNGIS